MGFGLETKEDSLEFCLQWTSKKLISQMIFKTCLEPVKLFLIYDWILAWSPVSRPKLTPCGVFLNNVWSVMWQWHCLAHRIFLRACLYQFFLLLHCELIHCRDHTSMYLSLLVWYWYVMSAWLSFAYGENYESILITDPRVNHVPYNLELSLKYCLWTWPRVVAALMLPHEHFQRKNSVCNKSQRTSVQQRQPVKK